MSPETAQSQSKSGQTIFYKFVSWLRLFQDLRGTQMFLHCEDFTCYSIDMMDFNNSLQMDNLTYKIREDSKL